MLIGWSLFVFHVMSSYLDPWSQAIINGIVKYTYKPDGQKETTVVLFREENLRALNEPYPVSYQRHAEVLEALSLHKPRAVFMDFVFNLDTRTDAHILSEAICDLAKAEIPVYLAVLPRPPVSEDQQEKNSTPIENPVFKCGKKVSAQMDAVHAGSGVLTYARHVRVDENVLNTPAFAMPGPRGVPDYAEKDDAGKMEIIWGNGVPDLNRKWMSECDRSGSWLSHLGSLFIKNPLKSAKLKCPYTQTITVGHLLRSSSDEDVAVAVRNKAVFYGAAFHLTGDRVASPVFEELPGVYLHAMAYDNLLTLRENYKRAEREWLIPTLVGRGIVLPLTGVVDVLLLLVTVTILLLVEEPPAFVQQLRERTTRMRASAKWLAIGIVALFVGVVVWTEAGVWLALPGLVALMASVAVLDLAPPAERPPETLQQFVLRRLLALIVPVLAVLTFITVDRRFGLEAAILMVALPAYFFYKVIVARDMLFAATAILLVLAALVTISPPVNLGPRNVVAYVTFFEVARKLLKFADEGAAQYFKLRDAHPGDREWGWAAPIMPALDRLFTVCRSGRVTANPPLGVKEGTHARPAGAPA